jgi:hypothetical protein
VNQRHGPRLRARGRNALPATVAKLLPISTLCCAHTRMAVTNISRIATAAAVL